MFVHAGIVKFAEELGAGRERGYCKVDLLFGVLASVTLALSSRQLIFINFLTPLSTPKV